MNKFNIEPNDLYSQFKEIREKGYAFQYMTDTEFNGRTVKLENKGFINLANCCYLGIEKHPALIAGSIDATNRYGATFSTSRALISTPLFKEAEDYLSQIFPGYPIIYSSTALANYAALPILIHEKDAIVLDAFSHNSIRTASLFCKANGSFIILSRHNDMDHLRYLIKRLKKDGYAKIWYCSDGIDSMHGDSCNINELHKILNEEDNFYAYIDDSHGTGWSGKNGCGFILGKYGLHPKMIVPGSLSKSIGASGGVLVVPDKELADYIKITSQSFLFSNPLPPSAIGALNASLALHLSNEIIDYQTELEDLIQYFQLNCKKKSIPIIATNNTPVFFVKLGETKLALKAHKQLLDNGFFGTLAIYPGVNKGEEGIRIQITRHITKKDIDNLITVLSIILTPTNHHNTNSINA